MAAFQEQNKGYFAMHNQWRIFVSVLLGISGIVYGQTGGGGDIDPNPTTGQGPIDREKELVPSFNELMWNDLFGMEFNKDTDVLFLKRYADGSAEIYPVRTSGSEWIVEENGTYEAHAEILDNYFDLNEQDVVLDTSEGVQMLNITGLLNVFAATFTGSNGVDWIVSGYLYDMHFDYTVPADDIGFSYSIIVAMNRHMTVSDGIDNLNQYIAQPRTIDTSDCADILNDCTDQAYNDYETGLGVVDATAPFYSLPGAAAGGTAGGGIGALVGWLFGPPGAAVGGATGGSLGALAGGFAGAHYEHAGSRYAETQRYKNRADRCMRCYESCVDHGEWPSWCNF